MKQVKKTLLNIDKEICKGCGICVDTCKKGLLKLSEHLNNHGLHYVEIIESEKCTGCAICATMCPDIAIEIWESSDIGD